MKKAVLSIVLVLLSVLGLASTAQAKPEPPPLADPVLQHFVDEGVVTRKDAEAFLASAPARAGPDTMAAQTAAYPPVNNTWVNVSSRQGSLNCLIEARQPGSSVVYVRKTAGTCYDMKVETYIYNNYYAVDRDTYSGPVPNGKIFEARASWNQAICYVYISWRDSAGVLRDALYMRGGGVG